MNPARYNEVLYEEAISQLEERHKIGVFAEKCPMQKGKESGTKAQKKAEKTTKDVKAPQKKEPKPRPDAGKQPQGGGGAMCGNPRQARYTPPSMGKLGAEVNNSEFDSCPEGFYFCTNAGECKPIPSGQGIGEDGMRVAMEYKECRKKDGKTYNIPDAHDCVVGDEVKGDKEITDEKAGKTIERALAQLGPKVAGKLAGALGVIFDPFDPAAAATLDEMGVNKMGVKPIKRKPVDPNNPYGLRKVKK